MQCKKVLIITTLILAPLAVAEATTLTLSGNVQFLGDLTAPGAVAKGAGNFVIDHPLKPKTHLLFHSFVESPDVKNIYDGIAKLDENGEATIALPDYFEALNRDFRYQFFPFNEAMPNLYIKEEVLDNVFVIGGGEPGGTISWQVTGIRHDPFIETYPIIVEVEKGPDMLVEEGKYLFPELYE